MKFLLSRPNVIDFLSKNQIIDITAKKSVVAVESKVCKNFNLLVSLSEEEKILVKQEPHRHNGRAKGDFTHEWQVYQLFKHFSALNELSNFCSPATYFDRDNAILVFNYLTEYCDLDEFYTQYNVFPTNIAASLGETIAKFHSLTFDNRDYESFLNSEADIDTIPDFNRDLDVINPEIFGEIGSDGLKFYELYQRDPSLSKAIANLQDIYEPCCLIHDDLKFNNILLHHHWQELASISGKQPSLIRLIDWEKWSWGDPALDLGSIVASYLKPWLNSITVNRYIGIEQALRLAGTPLEQIQPSLVVLLQSYCACFPEVLREFPDFVVRVMRFAGLGLIDSILAKLHYYEPFGNISICMLQVAKTLLCNPEQSIPTVFGLTIEEILSKEIDKVDWEQIINKKERVIEEKNLTLEIILPQSDRYDLVIKDIAEKIQIDTDYSISYDGNYTLALPDKLRDYFTNLSQSQQDTYLKYRLRDYLHEIYFSNDITSLEDSVIDLKNNIQRGINIDFYQQLSSNNCGVGYYDPDWNVLSNPHQGLILVEKNGLTLHTDFKRYLSPFSKFPHQGDTVAIRLPHNRIEAEFYVAIGNAGLIDEDVPVVSIYFNVDEKGAVILMKNLTQQLNQQKIPFEFSVSIDPEDYSRFDAARLRIESQHYSLIQQTIIEIYQHAKSHFQSQTPLFTKRITAGIGFAEEPASEPQDFGLHRCQMIAEALLTAWKEKITHNETINLIQQFLIQHGIDLEHPYLNKCEFGVIPNPF